MPADAAEPPAMPPTPLASTETGDGDPVRRGLAKALALISETTEVADIEHDSLSDPSERARFRSGGARSLAFSTPTVRFDVHVERVLDQNRLSGRIDPRHDQIELRHGSAATLVAVDEYGVFMFDDVPRGIVRLVLPGTDPLVATAPFPI